MSLRTLGKYAISPRSRSSANTNTIFGFAERRDIGFAVELPPEQAPTPSTLAQNNTTETRSFTIHV